LYASYTGEPEYKQYFMPTPSEKKGKERAAHFSFDLHTIPQMYGELPDISERMLIRRCMV